MSADRSYRVSEFLHPKYPVEIIQYGQRFNIPYEQWCQREVNRWAEKNFRQAWVEQCREEGEHKGDIALFTDRDNIISIASNETLDAKQ